MREYFDHTFKKPSDVTTYTGLPVLFSLSKPQSNILTYAYILIFLVLTASVIGLVLWEKQFLPFFHA